jgi:hypothetical protein
MDQLRQVRDWLLRPSANTLAACEPALERAVSQIAELLQRPPAQDANLRPAAMALRLEILQAQTLLASAGELYFGRIHRCTEAGAQTGQPEPPPEPISLTG